MNDKRSNLKKITLIFICAILLGTIFSAAVFAEDSSYSDTISIQSNTSIEDTTSSELSNTTSKSRLGHSSLVEQANSKAAEESRIAAQDGSTKLSRFFRDFAESFNDNFIENNGWKFLLNGLGVTLEVTFFAVIIGILLGFLVGTIRSVYDKTGKLRILNLIAKLYITVIRGTPVMVQLIIINFGIFQSADISKVFVAVIAFGLNSGAYVAEIFRSGIMSIDNGQMEAGRSLGLSYVKTMRTIIMPQAFKNVLPALGNEFIVLLKETSISTYIGLGDLTNAGKIISSNTYDVFWSYGGVAVIYLILVMGLTKLLSLLERRLRTSDNR